MTKTVKLYSHFLNSLTEALQKYSLEGKLSVVKAPIMEADGSFSSIVDTGDNFDPSKIGGNVFADEKEDEGKPEDKSKLVNKAVQAIKQTLDTTDELQSILNQIKKINEDSDYNEWKLNEKGNTATLKSKNAQIFKQNDKLCLSYNDNIELFDKVSELHDWLKAHDFPLPKNIKITEAVQEDEEGLETEVPTDEPKHDPWDDILATSGGYKIGDVLPPDSPEEIAKNREKFRKPYGKMGRDQYKDAMHFITKKDMPQQPRDYNIPGLPAGKKDYRALRGEAVSAEDMWYLEYQDKANDTLYLNAQWGTDDLLTNNISNAAIFSNRQDALNELDKVYAVNDTEAPFKPIKYNGVEECFGGGATTVSSLGAPVQYTGSSKKKNEEVLDETMYGYPDTIFADKTYKRRRDRGLEYLNAYGDKSFDISKLGDMEKNFELAKQDIDQADTVDKASKYLNNTLLGQFTKRNPRTGMSAFDDEGIIRPEHKDAYIKALADINQKYDLDIRADGPLYSRYGSKNEKDTTVGKYKVDQHNQEQRAKFIDWFRDNMYKNTFADRAKAQRAEFDKQVSQPVQGFSPELSKAINTIKATNFVNGEISTDDSSLFANVFSYRDKLNPQDYNALVDQITANPEQTDVSDSVISMLNTTKHKATEGKTESAFVKELKKYYGDKQVDNITLTEDETPADFASGTPTTDTSAETSTTSTSSIDTPDIDLGGSDLGGSSGKADFGDINLNIGKGGYSPEEGDANDLDIPQENVDTYQIIDVLVNDNNDSDIRVKLKNLQTGETEIKNLNEIDI